MSKFNKINNLIDYINDKTKWTAKIETECDDSLDILIQIYSDLGEDFYFTVCNVKTIKDFRKEVDDYYQDFDVEEHADMWYNRNNCGAPSSLRDLIKDAEDIDNKIESLLDDIDGFINKIIEKENDCR